MFTLSPRSAVLSSKFGGNNKTATDNRLDLELAVLLDPEEICSLFGDSKAYYRLYDVDFNFDPETGELHEDIEPKFPFLKALETEHDLALAYVKITFQDGVKGYVEYKNATLKKLRIKPARGGSTGLVFKLEGCPEPWDKRIPELIAMCGHRVQVELNAPNPLEQQDLPLNRFGEGERAASGTVADRVGGTAVEIPGGAA